MSKINTMVTLNDETRKWAKKNKINMSQELESALIKRREVHEGKILPQVDFETANTYSEIYKELSKLCLNTHKRWDKVTNELLMLEEQREQAEKEHRDKEKRLRQMQVEAFESFKTGFEKELRKMKGKGFREIIDFIRQNCPNEFRSYFFKIGKEICRKDDNGEVVANS